LRGTVLVTGAALVALGLGIFLWKVVGYDMPLAPQEAEGLWRVEVELTARGSGRRGSVAIPLPSTGPGQSVFDERVATDGLEFAIREDDGQRLGVWSGRFSGVHLLVHGFRVQMDGVREELPATVGELVDTPPELLARYGGPSPSIPVGDPLLEELLEARPLPPRDEPAALLRSLFSFVSDEIGSVETASNDALLTLAAREGTSVGKTRLLVALLRSVDIPSRVVVGLRLGSGEPPEEVVWAQAWVDGRWIPLSPEEGLLGVRPADRVALRIGSDETVDSTGVEATGRRYFALRERLRPEELASLMVPPNRVLRAISLYRLPVSTQESMRLVLLFPLGALIVAFLRNVIGIPTFGTFMPVLIAFALRVTSLGTGLALVVSVLGIGMLGRLPLERLRLLLVPRLSVLLCLVVLMVTGFALVASGTGVQDFFAGVFFPLVILTMLIERFSVTAAEEGLREAVVRAGWSLLVALAVYPVLKSATAEYLMFGFPELVFVVMGLLVWIGGYTGFRLLDLVRFRAFAEQAGGA